MSEKSDIDGVRGQSEEMYLIASDWWREDGVRLLPGEKGGTTVFVLEYQDGCRYVGCASRSVFGRLAELMAGPLAPGSDEFVREHGRRMAYLVHCVASNLDRSRAGELRDELVSQAPSDAYVVSGTAVTTSDCWLIEGEPEVKVLSFSEWAEARETEDDTAIPE